MYTAHVHFFTNLDLFCIDNACVIYRKIRYMKYCSKVAHYKIFQWGEGLRLCVPDKLNNKA